MYYFLLVLCFVSCDTTTESAWLSMNTLEESLFAAIDRLDLVEMERMILLGAQVNVVLRGITPLYLGIKKVLLGYDAGDIIKKLLASGASLDTVITVNHTNYTVGSYAHKALFEYIEVLEKYRFDLSRGYEIYDQRLHPIKVTERELAICIKRAQRVVQLISLYSAQ
jgi:hypothetical protein